MNFKFCESFSAKSVSQKQKKFQIEKVWEK